MAILRRTTFSGTKHVSVKLPDFNKLNKKQIVKFATKRGLNINEELEKDVLIETIKKLIGVE